MIFNILLPLSLVGTLRASDLFRLWLAPRSARTAHGTSDSVLCTFWTRANFVSDERQARMIICHRQEIAFAVGEYHCAVRGM